MWLQATLFAVGLIVLTVGADVFIRGASGLGERLGLSPLVIGLVIVGFGTSAPELAVSLSAVIGGHPDIAVGNVVGSNIANIGLILGATALIAPMVVQARMLRIEVPLLIAVSLLFWVMALDGMLERKEGMLLLLGQVGLMFVLLRSAPRESEVVQSEIASEAKPLHSWGKTSLFLILGLAGLVLGGVMAVNAAVAVARGLGISELVIGLTVVAVGTSLPELASSIVAGIRGQSDIAVGNVVGSNLFNILFILGSSATVVSLPVNDSLARLEIPVMVVFAVALLPLMRRKMQITRGEGALLLIAYLVLLAHQVRLASAAIVA